MVKTWIALFQSYIFDRNISRRLTDSVNPTSDCTVCAVWSWSTLSVCLSGQTFCKILDENWWKSWTSYMYSVTQVYFFFSFLSHLSTTCSRGAFRVVRCPSSVMHRQQFLKTSSPPKPLGQFGPNLGGPLQKLFTEFDSIKNSGCHGNKIEFFKQFFKNLLLWNHWSDFEIISQECSLGDPFQKLFAKFWSAKKHGSGVWGFLALQGPEEIP